MPIHDYDGTAYYEIGEIYDDDKTVYTQIGKVHDHDGTTYNLIYSAEEYLVGAEGNNSAVATYSNYCGNWYGDPVRCNAKWAFNATGWTTLHVDIKSSYTYYTNPDNSSYYVNSTCKFGVSSADKSVGTNYSQSTFSKYVWIRTSQTRTEYTIDISNLSGTQYFWIGLAAGGGGITANATLYNVWLT